MTLQNKKNMERFKDNGGYIKLLSSCVLCKHKHLGKNTCAAFSNGIPPHILSGKFDHFEPYDGDHGIQFEPVEDK